MRRNLIEETQLTAETKDVDEESGAGARVFNSGAERRKEENPKRGDASSTAERRGEKKKTLRGGGFI